MGKDIWDLSPLCPSEEAYLKGIEDLKSIIKELGSYKGKLSDEQSLIEYLALSRKMNAMLEDLYGFASMRSVRDKKNVENAADLQKIRLALLELSAATSFEEPELLSLGKEKLDKFLFDHPEFDDFSSSSRSSSAGRATS